MKLGIPGFSAGLQGTLLPLCREERRWLNRGGYEIGFLLLPLSPCFSPHPSSPPQQLSPPQRLGRGRGAELGTEGPEAPQYSVSEGSSGLGQLCGSCSPSAAPPARCWGLWAFGHCFLELCKVGFCREGQGPSTYPLERGIEATATSLEEW